jgi:tryptophan synthase beta chain
VPVTSGRGTLKDAMNDALRDWVTNVRDTFYCIGTVAGPHPYPAMVRDFQAIIGKETEKPDHGGRGPPAGHDHRRHRRRIERDGPVLSVPRRHRGGHHRRRGRRQGRERQDGALRLAHRRAARACCMATAPTCLQDEDGQILEGHSISAGLDYPGIGPEHAWLHDIGRAEYVSITDTEALEAFQLSCETEGIIPALEPSHALAHVAKIAPDLPSDHLIVMNMCGRGDKDIFTVARALGWDMEG